MIVKITKYLSSLGLIEQGQDSLCEIVEGAGIFFNGNEIPACQACDGEWFAGELDFDDCVLFNGKRTRFYLKNGRLLIKNVDKFVDLS